MESLRSVDREIVSKDKNLRKKEKREKKGDKEGVKAVAKNGANLEIMECRTILTRIEKLFSLLVDVAAPAPYVPLRTDSDGLSITACDTNNCFIGIN